MSFWSIMKAEIYKSCHTSVWMWHLAIPMAGVIMFVWYASFSAMGEMNQLSLYIEVLSLAFPTMIGIAAALTAQLEQNAAGCQLLLTIPKQKYLPHFGKFLVLLFWGVISSLLAVTGFGMGFRMLGNISFSMGFYGKLALILFLSMLPLYFIHYLVGFLFGTGYTIGLGLVGSLLSALLGTGLGDGIWYFLPWGIASRFSILYFIGTQFEMPYVREPGVRSGCITLFLMSVFFIILGTILFLRWDGRKSE